jgi:hypothetical protein
MAWRGGRYWRVRRARGMAVSKIVQIVTRPGLVDKDGTWPPTTWALTDDGRVFCTGHPGGHDTWQEWPPIPVASDRE